MIRRTQRSTRTATLFPFPTLFRSQVDDNIVTSVPAVTAVGECVEHRGLCYGLVAPLWEMCASLAEGLTTGPSLGYQGSVTSTKLKVSGIDVFSAGDFSGGDGTEDIVQIGRAHV